MRMNGFKTLLTLASLFAVGAPAFAAHGKLGTSDRDAWINDDLSKLASDGFARLNGPDAAGLTNLQVAQLTKEAAALYLAQAAPGAEKPVESAEDRLKRLVEEFKVELSALGMDLPEWEDRLAQLAGRNEEIEKLQEEYAKRTGTQIGGVSKGFFDKTTQSPNIASINANGFVELQLKSVPVPDLFFDGRFRTTWTYGQYFDAPTVELRWIQLSAFVDKSSFLVGDHYESYTPLTLWNFQPSDYGIYVPISYRRSDQDDAELHYLDHGPDRHFRGFQGSFLPELGQGAKESLRIKAMGGRIDAESAGTLGSYYGGGQATLSLFDGLGTLEAEGLLLWNDRSTSGLAYSPGTPATYEREYRVGSLRPALKWAVAPETTLSASLEWAGAKYQNDLQDPKRNLEDWALLGRSSLDLSIFHAGIKYLNVGPFYYSPGAQTAQSAYSAPASWTYANQFAFQGLGSPAYSAYSRLDENIFPYGDATPNREAWVGNLSAELGREGWIKPQVQGTLARELQANFVQGGSPNPPAAEDLSGTIFPIRHFTGLEGVLGMELAKPLGLTDRTFNIAADYKWQKTDLNGGLEGLTVSRLTAGTDFNLPIPGFESLLASVGLTLGWSNGSEFSSAVGSAAASYPFYLDTPLSSYLYQRMDVNWDRLVFGLLCPLSKSVAMKADLFIDHYDWNGVALYPKGRHFLRFTYEADF